MIGLALTVAVALATVPPADQYSVVEIEYALTASQSVGSVKAGFLCLPKSGLRWGEVARPEAGALIRNVENALQDSGLQIARRRDPLFGDPAPDIRYRIRIVIDDVRLKLCVAGLGIGERKPTTDGTVTLHWETYDRDTRTKTRSRAYIQPIAARDRDAREDSILIDNAVLASVGTYVESRRQP